MSNFEYLNAHRFFDDLATCCMEAEKAIAVSNGACALQTRRALKIAVKWMYSYKPRADSTVSG